MCDAERALGDMADEGTNSRLHDCFAITLLAHPTPHYPRWVSIVSRAASIALGAAPLSARPVMVDNKTKQAADLRRIDVHEPYELGYWSRKFGVSRQELARAVQKVGTNAEDVAIELRKSWYGS